MTAAQLGALDAGELALWDSIVAELVSTGAGTASATAAACIAATAADAAILERRIRVPTRAVPTPIPRCGAEHCDMSKPDALPDSDPCVAEPGHGCMHRSLGGTWSNDPSVSATREQAEQRRKRARERAS